MIAAATQIEYFEVNFHWRERQIDHHQHYWSCEQKISVTCFRNLSNFRFSDVREWSHSKCETWWIEDATTQQSAVNIYPRIFEGIFCLPNERNTTSCTLSPLLIHSTGQITYNEFSIVLFSYFDIYANETQNDFRKRESLAFIFRIRRARARNILFFIRFLLFTFISEIDSSWFWFRLNYSRRG